MPKLAAPLRLWRISNHESLSGEGGMRYSARWHTAGSRIVYLAESPAGAMVEVLVHLELQEGEMPPSYKLMEVAVTAGLVIVNLLPRDDWKLSFEVSRAAGDTWLRSRESALARVPSAILPSSWNYLLNPEHPDARRVEVKKSVEFTYDARLLRKL